MKKFVNKWGEPITKPKSFSNDMNGGSNNINTQLLEQKYYLKYLKYKSKYFKLKNQNK